MPHKPLRASWGGEELKGLCGSVLLKETLRWWCLRSTCSLIIVLASLSLRSIYPPCFPRQNGIMASKENELWERRMQNIKLLFSKYCPSHVIIGLQRPSVINSSTQGYTRTTFYKQFTLASTTSYGVLQRILSFFYWLCIKCISRKNPVVDYQTATIKTSASGKEWDSVTFCLFTYQNTFSLRNKFNYVLIGLNSSSCSQHWNFLC